MPRHCSRGKRMNLDEWIHSSCSSSFSHSVSIWRLSIETLDWDSRFERAELRTVRTALVECRWMASDLKQTLEKRLFLLFYTDSVRFTTLHFDATCWFSHRPKTLPRRFRAFNVPRGNCLLSCSEWSVRQGSVPIVWAFRDSSCPSKRECRVDDYLSLGGLQGEIVESALMLRLARHYHTLPLSDFLSNRKAREF